MPFPLLAAVGSALGGAAMKFATTPARWKLPSAKKSSASAFSPPPVIPTSAAPKAGFMAGLGSGLGSLASGAMSGAMTRYTGGGRMMRLQNAMSIASGAPPALQGRVFGALTRKRRAGITSRELRGFYKVLRTVKHVYKAMPHHR